MSSSPIDFSTLSDSGDQSEFMISCDDGGSSASDDLFDSIVGALENVLMDEDFNALQDDFCMANCEVFEETEESKLVYTTLFNDYTELIEGYIIARLTREVPNFSMDEFGSMLGTRTDEITGDVFDMLMSFTDFTEFKDLMLSYKNSPPGGLNGIVDIVSKENFASGIDMGGLSLEAGGKSVDPLSPGSREAKDASLSP